MALHQGMHFDQRLMAAFTRSLLPLTPQQVEQLCQQHIYLPPNGRINISGLNERNMSSVVSAIEKVVKGQVNNSTSATTQVKEGLRTSNIEARL